MKKTIITTLILGFLSVPVHADLVNIDFEEQDCSAGAESKSFGDVTFSKTQSDGAFFCAQHGPISNMPSSSGIGLLYGAAPGDFKLEAGKNGFDLISFDAATRLVYSTHLISEMALTGTFLSGGSITTTVMMNGEEASTYTPTGFNGLSSLRMVAIGSGERPQFILDNLTLNIEPNSSIVDVAVPGTGAILSMLALGAFSSRRRRSLSGQQFPPQR